MMNERNEFISLVSQKTWNTFSLIVPLIESITKVLIGKPTPEK
jgi:hypothetical protein